MSSVIQTCIPNECISFRNAADIKDWKEQPLADKSEEWSGGTERYSLEEKNGVIALTVTVDIPQAHRDEFEDKFPKALQRVKMLSER